MNTTPGFGASTTRQTMSKQRIKRVIGNWKMHGRLSGNEALLDEVAQGAQAVPEHVGIGVCVPFPYLAQARARLHGGRVAWGAQDVSAHEQGAFTGEVAAGMVAEFGAAYAIVGHSERRAYHGESNEIVAAKAQRALAAGLTPVVCVGETLAEREAGATERGVGVQLAAVLAVLSQDEAARIVVAYEPVWAIGTGRSATAEQAQQVHAFLRGRLAAKGAERVSLLYGGSVKADNAAELFSQPDIDGGLIGGASLKSGDFLAICRAAQ
ncbi:triose-phosphate isomerase [Burkholderia pseudomallei]|uniref:triose-phosphate isomerase n=1 Tax=Burkholderia pseudomallei TaxID=28450 RepID=UPI001AAE2653|nr:triose-phosphate isomerase [Burkholderia pseudomallei]MBO2947274.1 triose-phosphate isomerase [Burkholderia pseudomallei]